jgi:hypothetical protein
MNLKKLLPVAVLALLVTMTVPVMASNILPSTTNTIPKTEDPRAQQLMQRLEEIKAMDRTEMTRSEKKGLRKEVTGIKKEMKQISGGVYLSVGAIIIIVLLLILLL